jgi:hypothetical protein
MRTELGRTVADMLQNCMPKEMIVLAVDMYVLALESTRHKVDETAERRRAWDREYRKTKRERPPDPPDIHPTSADETLSFLREEDSYQEVVSKKERKKNTRGTKIPPDWLPKEAHYDEGFKRGMDRSAVDTKAEDMRIWCSSNSNRSVTTKSNWDQAFMGWLRREPERANGNATHYHRADPVAGRATAREAQHVATMGGAALRYLQEGNAARSSRDLPGDTGAASIFDIGKRSENAR